MEKGNAVEQRMAKLLYYFIVVLSDDFSFKKLEAFNPDELNRTLVRL